MEAGTQHDATLEAVRELFRAYAELVRKHFGDRTDRIWLYGSAARGDWTTDSDIDVLVLLRNEEEADMEWLVRTAYRIGLAQRHLLLQPVMLTTAEFDRLAARERRFAVEVLREGIAA
jgi:predicted nucleotidyltransferase